MEKIKILVVDDEFGIRAGIIRILSKFEVDYPFMESAINFELIEADTGEKAIELLNSQNFGIVLLDNKLPGIQGIEVLDYINKNAINTMVIMITSYASLELAVKATSQGAIDFVPKPFTPQELKTSIENITKQIFLKVMAEGLYREGKPIKFEFLSLLSHELKTPIDELENCLNNIKDKKIGNNIEDYIPILERSFEKLNNMRTMINDLINLTNTNVNFKSKKENSINVKDFILLCFKLIYPESVKHNTKLYIQENKDFDFKYLPQITEIVYNNLKTLFFQENQISKFIESSFEENCEYSKIVFNNNKISEKSKLITESDIEKYKISISKSENQVSEFSLNIVNKLYQEHGITINLSKDNNFKTLELIIKNNN
ncbi:MAG: response regulator [Bacteroidales bacterium]|nr:response regulator [Bacteroidales bacterium]MCK9498826.1 response regulator [Bacteroidales bacterium]MDY0314862.1 response regulator [Bacteroidales bacterium]